MKNKTEEFAVPSWIRANIKIEENWDKFERAQRQAEGGAELVASWSEVLTMQYLHHDISKVKTEPVLQLGLHDASVLAVAGCRIFAATSQMIHMSAPVASRPFP